jgi:hypothetical protein
MGVRVFDLTEHEHLHGWLANFLANGLKIEVVESDPPTDRLRLRAEGPQLRDGVEGGPLFSVHTKADGRRRYFVDWNRDGRLLPFRTWFERPRAA